MAIDLECSTCHTDEHIVLVERLSGTQKKLKCERCGHDWLRGAPERPKIPRPTLEDIKKRFPKPGDVDAGHRPDSRGHAGRPAVVRSSAPKQADGRPLNERPRIAHAGAVNRQCPSDGHGVDAG